MTQLLENIFAVEVPEDARGVEIEKRLDDLIRNGSEHPLEKIKHINPGSYEILFTTKKCKEDQAQSVVGKEGVHPSWPHNPLYTNYSKSNLYIDDARESLKMLLRSHGLDPSKNYLLLKKIS